MLTTASSGPGSEFYLPVPSRGTAANGQSRAEGTATRIEPTHPGAILRDEWLIPLGITAYRLAKDIGVAPNRITELINGRRAISAETALRLARHFGTDAQSWINLQTQYDLQIAKHALGERLDAEVKVRAA